jgi:murein L,D-transpeptidase YafK
MKPRKLLIMTTAAGAILLAGNALNRGLSIDSCLDSGGAWFGKLGCHHELPKVDRLVIDKSERQLSAYRGTELMREMEVSLGREPVGNKVHEGDNRTPEGVYPVVAHQRRSRYHLSLRLGYPTVSQRKDAQEQGIDPGGDIMIHGIRNGLGWLGDGHLLIDWTRGCIAVTNGEIEWLFATVADGTPVEIRS